jgi:hypothetical protein
MFENCCSSTENAVDTPRGKKGHHLSAFYLHQLSYIYPQIFQKKFEILFHKTVKEKMQLSIDRKIQVGYSNSL